MRASKSPRIGFSVRATIMIAAAIALAGCAAPSAKDAGAANSSASAPDQGEIGPALRLARAARDAGDFASSISLFRSVLAAKPDDPALLVELGDTLLAAGMMDDAIDVYARVGKTSAARPAAVLGLTRAYLALSQPAKALDYAEEAVQLSPQDARAVIARGVSLDMLDRHTEAQAAYRAVLRAAPLSVAARNDLALSLAMTGQLAEALAFIEPMARSPAAKPQTRQNLALIYGLMGDSGRAAAMSRMDLDEATTAANLSFFERLRSSKN